MTVVSQLCDWPGNVVEISNGYCRAQHVDLVCEVGESSSVDPSQSQHRQMRTRASSIAGTRVNSDITARAPAKSPSAAGSRGMHSVRD